MLNPEESTNMWLKCRFHLIIRTVLPFLSDYSMSLTLSWSYIYIPSTVYVKLIFKLTFPDSLRKETLLLTLNEKPYHLL